MDENKAKLKLEEVLTAARADMGTIRTGRATSALVEDIMVPAYGGAQNLRVQELASVTIPDPQTIVISPWDKSIIGDVKKGILLANVGLNPQVDSEVVRISLPPMTTEDRQRFVKLLNAKIENARVACRQVRADAMHDIKEAFEAKELSEDEKRNQEKRLQEMIDDLIRKIEEMGKEKEVELLHL